MKHLGDITKINGADIESVDVITFGAPCQDLSVAGKRAGMKSSLMGDEEDTRSGLFFHAIRIIKEMREHDKAAGRTGESVRCRYAIYENVPGALSSNSGYDFAAVLTELIRVVEPEAPDVPLPDKGWPMAGCFCADDHSWSVAYKVHDAQYWGVPQRRKRICVLADFNGDSAGDILFDLELRRETSDPTSDKAVAGAGAEPRPEVSAQCQGLPGNPDARGKARESLAGALESSVGDAGCFTLKIRGGCEGGGKGALIQTEKSGTLSCNNDQTLFLMDSIGGNVESYAKADKCGTLKATHYKMPPAIYAAGFDGKMGAKAGNIGYEEEKAPTLTAGKVMDVASFEPGIAGRCGGHCYDDVSGTLRANAGDNQMAVAYNIGNYASNAWLSDNPHSGVYEADQSKTLDAINCGYPGCNQVGTAVVEPIAFAQNQRNEVRDLGDKAGALAAESGMKQQTFIAEPILLESNQNHATVSDDGVCTTLPAAMGMGGGYVPMVTEPTMIEMTSTLTARMGTGGNQVNAVHCMDADMLNSYEECRPTELARQYKDPPIVTGTLCASGYPDKLTHQDVINGLYPVQHSVVRRLTPLECTRLQGFPDRWVDIGDWVDSKGKVHRDADSAKYKALGNSIALPFWDHLLAGISFEYDRIATLGSLFDGIGGFPYCWEIYNGKGSARWASEIEEFPIAVTKHHFGEE